MKLVWGELIVSQLVKEFPAMYVTRCFITMWTKNSYRPVFCPIKAVRVAEEYVIRPALLSIYHFPICVLTVSCEPLAQIPSFIMFVTLCDPELYLQVPPFVCHCSCFSSSK
jgi:hypothetical protein